MDDPDSSRTASPAYPFRRRRGGRRSGFYCPLNDETRRGFFMHGHYAVTEQGLLLGILGADIIVRDDEDFRQAANRRNLPIEEKESHRWIEGYQVFFRILKTGCRVERVQLKT